MPFTLRSTLRFILVFSVVLSAALFFSTEARAQDPGIQAAQQANDMAMQAAQQANAVALQQQQMAQQTANDQAQIAAQAAAQNNACCYVMTPKFSIKPGAYASTITLRMKDRTRGAVIYYTTDGWTPTVSSTRYTGPVTLSSDTTLQAVAMIANGSRSKIATGAYRLPGPAPALVSTNFPASAPGAPILMPGTQIPLVFTAPVVSRGLQVGDKLPVALAQDLIVGGTVIAHKGAPVDTTVTQVDGTGVMGQSAEVTFGVHSLTLDDGSAILLKGVETKEGQTHTAAALSISVVPLAGLLVRGEYAAIQAGALLTGVVDGSGMMQAQAGPAGQGVVAQP